MRTAEIIRRKNPDQQGNAADADQRDGVRQVHREPRSVSGASAGRQFRLSSTLEWNAIRVKTRRCVPREVPSRSAFTFGAWVQAVLYPRDDRRRPPGVPTQGPPLART